METSGTDSNNNVSNQPQPRSYSAPVSDATLPLSSNNTPTPTSTQMKCPKCFELIDIRTSICPKCQSDLRTWVLRHPVWSGFLSFFGILFLLVLIGGTAQQSPKKETSEERISRIKKEVDQRNKNASRSTKSIINDNVAKNIAIDQSIQTIQTSDKATTDLTNTKKNSPAQNETASQKNAVRKAQSYLSYSGFSQDGIVTQLEFEKFSHDDAVYGAANSGGDWNREAAEKAKFYIDIQGFSRDGLINQLLFEKFTQAQAEYGANSVGL